MNRKKNLREGKSAQNQEEKIIKAIGERFRTLRREMGYTSHEDFAYENGIDRTHYGKIERGTNIEMSTLIKITRIFKISLKDFFDGIDE